MARMFSTEFSYKNTMYTATVVISGYDGHKTIAIQVPEALYKVIPGGKIVVEPDGESKKPNDGTLRDPALVESILAEVEKHEADEPARSVWN